MLKRSVLALGVAIAAAALSVSASAATVAYSEQFRVWNAAAEGSGWGFGDLPYSYWVNYGDLTGTATITADAGTEVQLNSLAVGIWYPDQWFEATSIVVTNEKSSVPLYSLTIDSTNVGTLFPDPTKSLVLTMPSGVSGAELSVAFTDTTHGGYSSLGVITDYQSIAVPEPASLGVLSLGGLALLRRRRIA